MRSEGQGLRGGPGSSQREKWEIPASFLTEGVTKAASKITPFGFPFFSVLSMPRRAQNYLSKEVPAENPKFWGTPCLGGRGLPSISSVPTLESYLELGVLLPVLGWAGQLWEAAPPTPSQEWVFRIQSGPRVS